jgi:F0F1-type ATP synthase membrane subunit c/vacuolar-type H+-ATPase subunit K
MRGHWDTAATWMFTLACGGVAAEAVWNDRDHRGTAARAMGMGVVVTALLAVTARDPSAVPGVSLVVLVLLAVSAFPLIRHVSGSL